MKDHPLFNNDPNDTERRSRNIDFINFNQWINNKKQALPYQYEAEDLLTVSDVFGVVGEGQFELVGRENEKKRVVDRVALTIKSQPGTQAPAVPQPQAAQGQAQQQPASPPAPVMNLGNISIPPNMDPNMAIMLVMLSTQQQQHQASQAAMQMQMAAQREDARLFMKSQGEMMVGLNQNTVQLVTGLIGGLAAFIPRNAGGAEGTTDAFIKGIETMTELHAGIKEGAGAGPPTDWNTVTTNIVTAVKGIRDVAAITNGPPAPPMVPPGSPT